jgi:hypothetical protein
LNFFSNTSVKDAKLDLRETEILASSVLAISEQSLGAFAKLRKATISFMFVGPSAWNNSAPTERILMKLDI